MNATSTDRPSCPCVRFAHALDPYLDGELDVAHAADVEMHVAECVSCAEAVALARATRLSLKRTSRRCCPDALRARIAVAVGEERTAEAEAAEGPVPKLIGLKYALAFAAAAGVAFAAGISRIDDAVAKNDVAADPTSGPVTMQLDTLLDELVALHAHPLPPETTDPEALQRFDPLVGVPVRRPAFQPFDADFQGARIHALRERRAAVLQYTVHGGHRVSVYVFDPRATRLAGTRLRPRVVRERPVYVGTMRGYSVAALEQKGVGYALASDLNDDDSALMVAAVQP